MNGLINEQRIITAQNLANGYDMFIGRLLSDMYTNPHDGPFLLNELNIAIDRKQEAERLAEIERIQG